VTYKPNRCPLCGELGGLGSSQRKVLQCFIDEVRRTGCPPPVTVVEDLTGIGSYTKQVVRLLLEAGYLAQPYPRGPYLPVKDANGELITRDQKAMGEQ